MSLKVDKLLLIHGQSGTMSRPQTPAYAVRRPQLNTSVGSNFQTSRSATPLSRTVISLEEWEAKAPLTDEQVQSISLVKEKLGTRPLPEKVNWMTLW